MSDEFAPPSPEELAEIESSQSQDFAPPTPEELNLVEKEFNPIGASIGSVAGTATGYGTGALAEKTAGASQKLVEKFSPYTPSQLEYMANNYEDFKNIDPEQTLEKVRGQFIDKNRAANETLRSAYENLSTPVTRQDYQQAIVESAKPYLKDVPTTTPEFAAEVERFTPKMPEQDEIIIAQKRKQLKDFAELKAKEKAVNMRMASLGTIPEEAIQAEYAKTKAQIMSQGETLTPEGFVFQPDFEAASKQMDSLKTQKQLADIAAQQRAIESFQTPLAQQFPQLEGKMFSSSAPVDDASVKKLLGMYKYGDLLSGEESYELDKNLRELGYTPGGEVKNDAAKAAAKSLRNTVGAKNPEASQKLQEMSKMITELTDLEKSGYLKRDKTVPKSSDEFIKFGEKQQSQVLKDLAPNLYKSGVNISNDDADRLAILKKTLPPELYSELELASLKQAMSDPRKQLKLAPMDTILALYNPVAAAAGITTKGLKTAEGSLSAYRAMKGLKNVASKSKPVLATLGGLVGGPVGAFAGEVAAEATDVEPSGASPDMPDYWLEKGVRDPEEQRQRALLSSFKQGLPNQGATNELPGAYDKPAVKKYKESVLKAKQAGQLKDNYVEKFEDTDSVKINEFMNFLQGSGDKLGEEYSRVLSQVADAPDREKSAVLFSLNQNPAFRQLAKRYKGNE
jgi:hypothetical protein